MTYKELPAGAVLVERPEWGSHGDGDQGAVWLLASRLNGEFVWLSLTSGEQHVDDEEETMSLDNPVDLDLYELLLP